MSDIVELLHDDDDDNNNHNQYKRKTPYGKSYSNKYADIFFTPKTLTKSPIDLCTTSQTKSNQQEPKVISPVQFFMEPIEQYSNENHEIQNDFDDDDEDFVLPSSLRSIAKVSEFDDLNSGLSLDALLELASKTIASSKSENESNSTTTNSTNKPSKESGHVSKKRKLESRIGRAAITGKYSHLQIQVCIENSFYENEAGRKVLEQCEQLRLKTVPKQAPVKGMIWFEYYPFTRARGNMDENAVNVVLHSKEPIVMSGSTNASVMSTIIVVWPASDFARKMCLDGERYDSLREDVHNIKMFWEELKDSQTQSRFTKSCCKIILLLPRIQEFIAQARQGRQILELSESQKNKLTLQNLHDALAFLFVCEACEHRFVTDDLAAATVFGMLCGGIIESVHYQLPSMLDIYGSHSSSAIVKNLVQFDDTQVEEPVETNRALEPMTRSEMTKTWCNQLRYLLSDAKSMAVCQKYPTLRSLVNIYRDNDLEESEKENLLCGISKISSKLSKAVYQYFTTRDPNVEIFGKSKIKSKNPNTKKKQ